MTLLIFAIVIIVLAGGISSIYIAYLRAERAKVNQRLRVFLNPRHTPWRVDKQVVEKPKDESDSLALVVYEYHGPGVTMDLSNPRQVRVNITNGTQIKHIADCDLEDEEGIIAAIAQAEERCLFLNAHRIK